MAIFRSPIACGLNQPHAGAHRGTAEEYRGDRARAAKPSTIDPEAPESSRSLSSKIKPIPEQRSTIGNHDLQSRSLGKPINPFVVLGFAP